MNDRITAKLTEMENSQESEAKLIAGFMRDLLGSTENDENTIASSAAELADWATSLYDVCEE